MSKAVFTSCNLFYLDRALLLARSFKQYNRDIHFILMLSDHVDRKLFEHPAFAAFDMVVETADIGIPDFDSWSFQHDVVELCTAVKGHCFRYLGNIGYDKIIYLDPDIACFSDLDFLFACLGEASILLTPHQLLPAQSKEDIIDNELCSHKHGIFNLGFLGVRLSGEGERFIAWWSSRLHDYCKDDIPGGMFTDQKWCDAVPSYFKSYQIIHHPGCNVASWNLVERQIIFTNGRMMVNDQPLVFYHFTKYFKEGMLMTRKYATSLDAVAVWNWYGRKIASIRTEMPEIGAKDKYSVYADGRLISRQARLVFREKREISQDIKFSNPYDMSSTSLREAFGVC